MCRETVARWLYQYEKKWFVCVSCIIIIPPDIHQSRRKNEKPSCVLGGLGVCVFVFVCVLCCFARGVSVVCLPTVAAVDVRDIFDLLGFVTFWL